jgi:DMSO/TMAO reductase YedYZ molybdopterin-dependent catalytic subunit
VRHFLIGVIAGLAFVVVELAGRVFLRIPTLPELIQDRLVLLTPGPVFAFILDRLLYLGKPTFFASLLLLQLVLAGLGGLVLARWSRPLGLAAVLWLVTGLVVLPLTGQGVFANRADVAVLTLLAFGAYALAFAVYSGFTGWSWPPLASRLAAPRERAANRRLLLGGGVTFLASLTLGRWIVGTLPTVPPRAASPGGPALAPGLPPEVTPNESFYVVSKNLADPDVDVNSWRLDVRGLVDHPQKLRYDDVLALPAVATDQTLMCISNEVGGDLISNGRWTGVRLADLLQRAGVQSGAQVVRFTSVDDYTETMPLQQALDPTTLLVYRLNDEPLPAKHGFPLRVLSTNTYGMKNPKWLTSIEVVASSPPGFWQRQGWNTDAIVQTMSEIRAPESANTLPVGTMAVVGVGFAGARGIRQVDVSADNGQSWAPAQLFPPIGPLTWVFWQFPWTVDQPGLYTLVVRATDGTGALQTNVNTETFPNGATGYHHVTVRVTA